MQVADERHHHHPALLILAACAAAAGCGGAKKSDPALTRPCGPAPHGRARPALLGSLPTSRTFVYGKAAKHGKQVVAVGYDPESVGDADTSWRVALLGGGHWRVKKDEGRGPAQREITFQQFGFNDFSGAKDVGAPGRVRLRQTCRNRTIATVTFQP